MEVNQFSTQIPDSKALMVKKQSSAYEQKKVIMDLEIDNKENMMTSSNLIEIEEGLGRRGGTM